MLKISFIKRKKIKTVPIASVTKLLKISTGFQKIRKKWRKSFLFLR